MTKLADLSKGVLIGLLVVYIIIIIYAMIYDKKRDNEIRIYNNNMERYYKFSKNLSSETRNYSINELDKHEIEEIVNKILEKKTNEKSLLKRIVNSGKTGFLLGSISGGITGGPQGAMATGFMLALVNPIVITLNEFLFIPEDLNSLKERKYRLKIKNDIKKYIS